MAVSGNADIFSIKVDSRLKTTLFPTGFTTEMNFNSVFFEKFISSPKCRFRECSWQGWGQNTLYSHTHVLEYIFSCTRDVLVLVVLVSKCTGTCTRVHSKIGCTHEYILSTI